MKSVGAASDRSNLPIEALDPAVVEAITDILEDTLTVLADRPRQPHEGRQARAAGPVPGNVTGAPSGPPRSA